MPEKRIEEETYSLIFKSLKHPIRRKILRILVNKQLAFSEILDILSIDSGHLSYHIENLGDMIKHSANGKYELSSIGTAAVNLMGGVEEPPQLLTPPKKLSGKKIRNILMAAVFVILVISAALNIYYYNSLQASLEKNSRASRDLALAFEKNVVRATDIEYLLWTYREGLRETEPNEGNIEALIGGFFYEWDYAEDNFRMLMTLNPELSDYEKPLYLIQKFIIYTIVRWEAPYTAGPTVRSVLYHLLSEAHSFANYSIPLTAFKELNQTFFQKIDELAYEVVMSFAPFNPTRLDNAVNMVEELQGILDQWIDKYSQM